MNTSRQRKYKELEPKVRALIEKMRDSALVDFMRASDREMVVGSIVNFCLRELKESK